ncbi:MAG: amidohydrolase [Bacillota bacterium]|nr:amidohydrolase [Bacillota bacterium]MDW7677729.1 amidohydrolase [Bacillota bacterium]
MSERVLYKEGIIQTKNGETVDSMLVASGKITAVGSREEVIRQAGIPDTEFSLGHHFVLPGFVDSHIHLMAYGFSLDAIDLSGADSLEAVREICRRHIGTHRPEPGKWIIGRGWNQNLFADPVFPTREALDDITQEHPLLLLRICGHIATVNTLGLRNVYPDDRQMPEAMKKWLEKGIVLEDELEWFKTKMEPKPDRQDLKKAILKAAEQLLRFGVTSVHTEDSYDLGYGGDFRNIQAAYRELETAGELPLRIYQKISLPDPEKLETWLLGEDRTGSGSDFYRTGPMKMWLDGTLGARTAALQEPYTDDPENRGMLLYPDEVVEAMVMKAHAEGMQICLHAIGDAALNQAVTVYEKVFQLTQQPLKHRIIHCQIGSDELYRRMAAIGVTGDLQFAFTASDWPIVEPRVGAKRAARSYAWKSLLSAGVPLTAGSDCPVEIPNPFIGIQAAVTRRDLEGHPEHGFNPEEALTLQEAIGIHTQGSAAASGEATIKGTLEPGKVADFIVLSHNPYEVHTSKLADIRVHATWVDGKLRWQDPGALLSP